MYIMSASSQSFGVEGSKGEEMVLEMPTVEPGHEQGVGGGILVVFDHLRDE